VRVEARGVWTIVTRCELTSPRSRQLYKFLARRTTSKFNDVVYRRLCMTKTNRPPVSTSKLTKLMKNKGPEKIAVVVGKVTDDTRMTSMTALTVCALAFTDTARARITAAHGKCLTFDQLAVERPTGANCVLVRGKPTARDSVSYFGLAPGVPGSTTK
jgi:large subunit ribosomal protein L18e